MKIETRRPTDEEIVYYEMAINSPRTNLEIYDRLFAVFIAIAGFFISTNTLSGKIQIIIFISSWLALLCSFIGVIPTTKKINPHIVDEIKTFVEIKRKEKQILLYLSVLFLFFSFGVALASAILK